MKQTTPWAQGITRKAFLTAAAASTAAFALRPTLLWGKDQPIKLGGQHSLTRGLAFTSIWGNRAAEAAVKKLNQEGGIKGRKVEYVFEDSETNVQTGIRKMRKLIEQDQVDFIIGDVHSGVNVASAPIAQEENTVYFAYGTAVATTEEKGNRYVFRGMTNMRIHMKALVLGGLERWGKRWYTMAADYAWGHPWPKRRRALSRRSGAPLWERSSPRWAPRTSFPTSAA